MTLPRDRSVGITESPLPLEPLVEGEFESDLRPTAHDEHVSVQPEPTSSPAATFIINGAEPKS
jgi:hypothetical protein